MPFTACVTSRTLSSLVMNWRLVGPAVPVEAITEGAYPVHTPSAGPGLTFAPTPLLLLAATTVTRPCTGLYDAFVGGELSTGMMTHPASQTFRAGHGPRGSQMWNVQSAATVATPSASSGRYGNLRTAGSGPA